MNIYELLNKLNIKYEEISHPAVYTVAESQLFDKTLSGIGCKNLFLTAKNKQFFLVVLEENKRANIKEIESKINVKHLSFAKPEQLSAILNLIPGSVTPLGVINDTENQVIVLLDSELQNNKILIHPNTNTKTISIEFSDLIKILDYTNHKYIMI